MSEGARQVAEALSDIAAVLERLDEPTRLTVLQAVAMALLRRMTRQQAVDWIDRLFVGLDLGR